MTNNKQQTAVDILCGKLAMKLGIPQAITFYIDHAEEIAEAKAMHKEEIRKVSEDWWNEGADYMYDGQRKYNSVDQYYNETFGGNNEQR